MHRMTRLFRKALVFLGLLMYFTLPTSAQSETHWTACTLHLDWRTASHVVAKECRAYPMPKETRRPIGYSLLRTIRLSPHVEERVWWPTFARPMLESCPSSIARWSGPIIDASRRFRIPVSVITGIISIESGGDPAAYNPSSGASGLMQILPSNFASLDLGAPFYGPANIEAGALLLARMGGDVWSYSGGGYGLGTVLARSCD